MIVTYGVQKGITKNKCDDAVLIATDIINCSYGTIDFKPAGWVCLADGVGGNAGGNQASQFVLRKARQFSQEFDLL